MPRQTSGEMRTIHVCRAEGAVEPAAIVIADAILKDDPASAITPEDSYDIFAQDAGAIAEVLWTTLPGGTIDALLCALLAQRASLLHVPMSAVNGR